MSATSRASLVSLLTVVLSMGAIGPAWSAKPEWAGHPSQREEGEGRHDRQRRDERRDARPVPPPGPGAAVAVGAYFADGQRQAVLNYYQPRFAAGKCPPGLAKKGNGCLPPGQAKQWQRGQALPAGVVTYPVPRELQRRLGPPPAGHEFVRVASDILLIAVGTSMVIDAIEDLSR
jgi:Ni/Co efflux regulator RcnB